MCVVLSCFYIIVLCHLRSSIKKKAPTIRPTFDWSRFDFCVMEPLNWSLIAGHYYKRYRRLNILRRIPSIIIVICCNKKRDGFRLAFDDGAPSLYFLSANPSDLRALLYTVVLYNITGMYCVCIRIVNDGWWLTYISKPTANRNWTHGQKSSFYSFQNGERRYFVLLEVYFFIFFFCSAYTI